MGQPYFDANVFFQIWNFLVSHVVTFTLLGIFGTGDES